MNIRRWGLVAPVFAVAAFVLPAVAATGLYATEDQAKQACGAEEVVFVNLDNGRFYHKAQADYGKSTNGGYTCQGTAHSQYRESHSS